MIKMNEKITKNSSRPEHLKFIQLVEDEKTSSFNKYRNIVVGNTSLSYFLWSEALFTFCGLVPGALGLMLRKMFYPTVLGKCGKGVIFGWNVTLRHSKKISIGNKSIIDDMAVLSARGSDQDGIRIGEGVLIGRNTHVILKEGTIDIGNNSRIGPMSFVGTTQSITMGEDVTTGPLCTIGLLTKDDSDPDLPNTQRDTVERGGVVLGNGVALGGSVVVLDGIKIGSGSVVGAGSVVTKDIPAESVAVGSPAKVIRKRREN
jgi:acetyltransferase-like isoleucine patch superfamily enzyme